MSVLELFKSVCFLEMHIELFIDEEMSAAYFKKFSSKIKNVYNWACV